MSKWRDKYFREYTVEKEIQENGRGKRIYLYHGNYYFWQKPERVRKNKRLYCVFFLFDLIFYFATTMANSTPNQTKLLAVPVLLTLIAMMFELYAIALFCLSKEKIPEFEFEDLNLKLVGSAMSNFILMALACVLSVFCGVWYGPWLPYIVTAVGYGVCAVCALTVYRLHKKLRPVMVAEGEGAENYKQRMQKDASHLSGGR